VGTSQINPATNAKPTRLMSTAKFLIVLSSVAEVWEYLNINAPKAKRKKKLTHAVFNRCVGFINRPISVALKVAMLH